MKTFAALAAAALFAAPAIAQEVPSLEPGMWTTTTTTTMSIGGTRTRTDSECITPEEATFDPESLMAEDTECTVGDVSTTATSASFTVTCAAGPMSMTGTGDYNLAADRRSGSGTMNMAASMNGMDVTMDATFVSERTGDC
ncbi:MAG: DUF3617 family protein [Pseudomonadota bacterium]